MRKKTITRFYKDATAATVAGGFGVHLDGKPVKTPGMRPLTVPNAALAEAIASEWAEQGETVRPHAMPLTQLAATAIDRVGPERAIIMDQVLKYAGTDLLCYRTTFPPDLAERQHTSWQPLLDWAEAELGVALGVTEGVMAIEQPAVSLAALAARLEGYDDWRLTGVQAACAAAGSVVLALALAERRLDAAETFALSQLDESYQIEKWGEDYEATQWRATLERDITAAYRLLALL